MLLNIQQLQCLNPEYPTAAISLNKKEISEEICGDRPSPKIFGDGVLGTGTAVVTPGLGVTHARKISKKLESLNLCHSCCKTVPVPHCLACYMLHCDGPAARVPGSGQRQQPIAGAPASALPLSLLLTGTCSGAACAGVDGLELLPVGRP